jgi:hypothetical protein
MTCGRDKRSVWLAVERGRATSKAALVGAETCPFAVCLSGVQDAA